MTTRTPFVALMFRRPSGAGAADRTERPPAGSSYAWSEVGASRSVRTTA
ncbi:hypothetical protein ACNKF0_17005 [Nocardioides sp. T5]